MKDTHVLTTELRQVQFPVRLRKDSSAPRFMIRLGYGFAVAGLLILLWLASLGFRPWDPFMLAYLLTLGLLLFAVFAFIGRVFIEDGRAHLGSGYAEVDESGVRLFLDGRLVRTFSFDSKTVADVRLYAGKLGRPVHPTALIFKRDGDVLELGVWEGYEQNQILAAWHHFLAVIRHHDMKESLELTLYLMRLERMGRIEVPWQ